jgi:outer membrane protein insertion porin family
MTVIKILKKHIPGLIFLLVVLIVTACKLTKHVPEGKFLLKTNKLEVEGDKMDESEMLKVIRQQPNLSALGVKWRLIAYNTIDSTSVAEKRQKISQKWHRKNEKRRQREVRINTRRRERALSKGDSTYYYRKIPLKDTLNLRISLKERIKYKFGEAPVIVDSSLFQKSKEQLHIYMNRKGYYFDTVSGWLDTLKGGGKKKITAHYKVITGPRYYIDSVNIRSTNGTVTGSYLNYLRKEPDESMFNRAFYRKLVQNDTTPIHVPFDQNALNSYKSQIAQYMRNDALYGFSPANVIFRADTTSKDMSVILTVEFTDRVVEKDGMTTTVPFETTYIKDVNFYYSDTLYTTTFSQEIEKKQLEPRMQNGHFTTLDTFQYNYLMKKVSLPEDQQRFRHRYYKSTTQKNLFGGYKDSVATDKYRIATFHYNGKMFVKPGLVEAQNYLENENYYKDYYLDRSYNRLLQLGIFQSIRPEVVETDVDSLVVNYYLTPAKKQSYSFEPRATNSNGFLGVSASVNYLNKNLFRSGWNTTVSLSGGFESQPPVFAKEDGQTVQQSARSFNTFEFGPTIKFDLPGLFPVRVENLDKRQRPRTVLSTAYNYQHRPDFDRSVFQLNYLWKFFVGKTQVISIGLPAASVIKFVSMDQSDAFKARIEELNDLFLRNAYSDQFIWEDLKLVYEYDNLNSDKKPEKLRMVSYTSFNAAGHLLYFGFRGSQEMDNFGHYTLFGVPYSQFSLGDTRFTVHYDLNRKHQVASRIMAGVGVPYLNTKTSLPYDYAFSAGGANDNRGWVARSLGPGSYKYYLDPKRTATQIGDIRLAGSLEYRLGKGRFIQSAVFADAGNIWTINEDVNRLGGQFSKNWYKELGIAAGYGIRLDFNFFIFRLDLGIPLHNPGLPEGARWIWNSRDQYNLELDNSTLTDKERRDLPRPFGLRLNFGIGLPF